MSRNEMFDALLALGQTIEPSGPGSTWGEIGRKFKDPATAQYPALWQVEGDSENQSKLGQMQRREEQALWVIIQGSGKDQAIEPARFTQDLKDKIEALFRDTGISFQTLGGQVYSAWIKGALRRFPGDVDGIEMLTVPIALLLP